MKKLILLNIASLIIASLSAQNMIVNGDFEGKDLSCFSVNNYVDNKETQEPRVLSDDSGNHYLAITGGQQLHITLSESLKNRSYVVLSMKVKADDDYGCRIGLRSTPATSQNDLHKRINIGTEWRNYIDTLYIRDEKTQILSIIPGANYQNNQYYFDDISIEVDSYSFIGPEGFRLLATQLKEIKQGERISITYALDAYDTKTNYSFNGGIEGGKLEEVYLYNKGGSVNINASFTMLKAGKLKVLPMTLVIDGKEICSDSTYINVIPDSVAEAKWRTVNDSYQKAIDFFENKGIKYPNLVCKYETETLCAFSDDWHHCFAIVAREPYAQYLDNPILAYGINEFAWYPINDRAKSDDDVDKVILEQYDHQLRYLFEKKKKYTNNISSIYNYKSRNNSVAPLLGRNSYGQSYPYNKYLPHDNISTGKEKHCAAGCTAVSLAQILSYYHRPVQLKGTKTVKLLGSLEQTLDMSKYPIKWDGTEDDIAALIYNCTASVSADITSKSSSASLAEIADALVNIWGYSNTCEIIINKKSSSIHRNYKNGQYVLTTGQDVYITDDIQIWSLIYLDLDNERPVIIGGGGHAYVCDGFDGDYVHYNFGWEGLYNGYYRKLILPEIEANGSLHINSCIIGVTP